MDTRFIQPEHSRVNRALRHRCQLIVAHKRFQQFIIWVIVVNAMTLGLETSDPMMATYGPVLHAADRVMLAIFVIEIGFRLCAYRFGFFRDPWNVFDFLVIGISLFPMTGPLSVLRTLRVLRALRLVSAVPAMRRVTSGLLAAVPGMASIAALLVLIIYVAAVIATELFGPIAPAFFGDLGTTYFSLFQTMTGEGWPDIAREVMVEAPLAWIFFVIFILVSSFAVLNLFIAVIVNGMEKQSADDLAELEDQHAADQAATDELIFAELQALRRQVTILRTRLADSTSSAEQSGKPAVESGDTGNGQDDSG